MKTCATCKFASRCKTNDYLCRHSENAKLDVWERVKEWHNTCQQWEKKESTKKPTNTMNQETDTPQTDEIETVYEQQRESVGGIIEHARELERELNAAMKAISRHLRQRIQLIRDIHYLRADFIKRRTFTTMKEQTDTPRTDEAYNEWLESQKASDILNRMMQLERELNACEADYAVTKDERDQYRRELNAAKAIAEQNDKLAHDYSIAAVKFKGQLNEAITELSHIANLLDDHFENGGIIVGMGTTNKARQIIAKSKQ